MGDSVSSPTRGSPLLKPLARLVPWKRGLDRPMNRPLKIGCCCAGSPRAQVADHTSPIARKDKELKTGVKVLQNLQ